jgi:ABC-2 type transport system ATP-binding protein
MLDVRGIKRVYANGRGLKGLSFNVSEGEAVCIVGPNGAGKTTAVNCVAGIAKCGEGKCLLNGKDTVLPKVKPQIGYLEEAPFYYENVTVEHFLNFIWSFKYPGCANDEIYRLLEKFDLMRCRSNRMGVLSAGMLKRVGIISALMNYPRLIVLDEPANSIDATSLIALKEELELARRQGCHILISDHAPDFIKAVATRILFLKDGACMRDAPNEPSLSLEQAYRALNMAT